MKIKIVDLLGSIVLAPDCSLSPTENYVHSAGNFDFKVADELGGMARIYCDDEHVNVI